MDKLWALYIGIGANISLILFLAGNLMPVGINNDALKLQEKVKKIYIVFVLSFDFYKDIVYLFKYEHTSNLNVYGLILALVFPIIFSLLYCEFWRLPWYREDVHGPLPQPEP